MKKLFLLMIVLTLFFSGCVDQSSGTRDQNSSKSQINEVTIFQPQLTYLEAYNGPLYDTSAQMGSSPDLELYFNNHDRNGINFFIGFFQIELDDPFDVNYLNKAIKTRPGRVIPFFNTGLASDEAKLVVGNKLTSLHKEAFGIVVDEIGSNVLKGIGETEQYAWGVEADDPQVLKLYDFANSNDLHIMFHPPRGQTEAVKRLVEMYPGTIFLIHMFPEDFDADRQSYIDLIKTHDNLFFSIDADHILYDGSTGLLYKYENQDTNPAKISFISFYDSNEQQLLDNAVIRYKPLVDSVPDKVMWGTESSPEYNFEPEVYDRIIKFSRLFIGRLNQEHHEVVAYKNALKVFGNGTFISS